MNGKSFDFDEIVDRRGTASEKWDKYRGRDVIPLWVADMDFRSPPAVIEALHERVSHGVFGYTAAPEGLSRAVLAALQSEFGWQVQKEWITWLPGLVTGLNVCCRAVGAPQDEVISFTPVYPPFLSAPPLAGRTLVTVPLRLESGSWGLDLEALERAVTRRSRLLLLCSPHNPVGRVWSREELEAVADIAQRHGVLVVSDEIHGDLVFRPHRLIPFGTLTGIRPENVVTLTAPSKTFNLAGLEASLAIIPDSALRARFVGNQRTLGMGKANFFGLVALEAAYRHGEPWLEELLSYLEGNARHLVEFARREWPGIEVRLPEGTYLGWLDCRALGLSEEALHDLFFRKARVGLNRGAQFGGEGRGHMRLNFGTPRAVLDQGLQRISGALRGGA